MYTECFLMVALAFLGASAAPFASAATIAGTVGPTVSETIITPCHRTDSVATPCGQSIVRTTALPTVPYGVATGFLGTGGVFPGVVGNGFAGSGLGTYPGIVGGGYLGNAGIGYQGVIGGGIYPGVGGLAGVGIVGGGVGVYPNGNLVV